MRRPPPISNMFCCFRTIFPAWNPFTRSSLSITVRLGFPPETVGTHKASSPNCPLSRYDIFHNFCRAHRQYNFKENHTPLTSCFLSIIICLAARFSLHIPGAASSYPRYLRASDVSPASHQAHIIKKILDFVQRIFLLHTDNLHKPWRLTLYTADLRNSAFADNSECSLYGL